MADQPPAIASDAALAVAEPTDLGYAVSLEAFSGPLDLLLYLVRKTELDIADIPVSVIADQFVATVRGWQERDELDLEIAGDFILMAATLIEIKARALAPPPEEETNDDGSADDDEFADPRADLIRKLLAYRKYKEAAQLLVGRETARAERVYRRFKEEIPEDPEEAEAIDLGELDPGGLAKHWFTIVARLGGLGPRTVSRDDIPIESRITSVLARAEEVRNVTLTELFERETSLQGRVTTLMAILEVVRQRYLESRQLEQYGGVDLRWREAEERTRAAELPPAELEEPKRRRRRPPLLTWVPRADIPSESTTDAETESETTPEPFESDEERFLRELNESCNLDQVLVRAKDWESEFAAHWNELHPPPAPEPAPVAELPPVAIVEAAPAPEPISELLAEVVVAAPEVALVVAPEAEADGSTQPPKPTKPKWVPPWVLAKQAKERAALEQAEQAALEQAAHAPVVAKLTPEAERAEESLGVLDALQTTETAPLAPAAEIAADPVPVEPLEPLAQDAPRQDEIPSTADIAPLADLLPATGSPNPVAESTPEPTVALVSAEPTALETAAIEPDVPSSTEPVADCDEPPLNEIPPVGYAAAADVEPVDAPEVVVAARDLGLAQPEAITELEDAATTSLHRDEPVPESATIDRFETESEPVADLNGEESPTPISAPPVTALATDDARVRSVPEPKPLQPPSAPIASAVSLVPGAMPTDEPTAAPQVAAEALPTLVDATSSNDDHASIANPLPEVAAKVVVCAQADATEPRLELEPEPVSAPAEITATHLVAAVEHVHADAEAPPATTATTTATTTSPWPLALALGLSGLLIGGLFLSIHLARPAAAISRIAPTSPTPLLVIPDPIVLVEPLPATVPLPTLWELWTTVEPTRWIALIRPAVVPWTAWLPTPPPWPALDDLATPIDLTTLPVTALGVPGGGIFARSAALPSYQVVPWDAYLPRPPQAPSLVDWIAATSRTDVPLAAWAQADAWTLMIAPQPPH